MTVFAAAITQGFASTQNLPPGSLAATLDSKVGEVVGANTENANNIVGVVVTGDTATLNINATAAIHVATSGSAEVFVTDLAGAIKAGDKITASPLNGVGMKANDSVKIVGVAEEDLDAQAQSQQQTITSRDGRKRQVKIGMIPVRVQVSYYSAPQEKTIVPPPFQQFSNAVAGKQVSPLRVIIGFFVILAAIVSVSIMLFSAMKSSIISIGRNPLASKNIYKGVFEAFGAGAVILAVAVGGAYVIMRL
jgi:uncharacterized membrane protein YphA (DoxX/SURF4 family)